MKNTHSIKSKVAEAVKFFFMGDDEPTINSPSSATRLIDKQLDMVTGSNSAAIANNAFKPTTEKKKGGASGSWDRGGASGGASDGWGSAHLVVRPVEHLDLGIVAAHPVEHPVAGDSPSKIKNNNSQDAIHIYADFKNKKSPVSRFQGSRWDNSTSTLLKTRHRAFLFFRSHRHNKILALNFVIVYRDVLKIVTETHDCFVQLDFM